MGHPKRFPSSLSMKMTKTTSVVTTTTTMMIIITFIITGCHALSSAPVKDLNLPFTYFHRMSDPNMNTFESPVYQQQNQQNPLFNRLFLNNDSQQLFLAGLDFLYALNPANISKVSNRMVNLTSFRDFDASKSLPVCRQKLLKIYPLACNNVVQMLFWKSAEPATLRVCTSGFGVPQEFVVDSRNMTVVSMSNHSSAGKCSGIPYSNSTILYEEKSNAIFSGTPWNMDREYYYGKYLINSNWEIEKQFQSEKVMHSFEISYVASLSIDNFIYVFLHELPPEDTFYREEQIFYTRIGRICKNEPGNNLYSSRAVTYSKVRVFCKDPTTLYPVYYDVVNDVYYDIFAKRFYLLLSTQREDATAICYVDRATIDSKFENSPLSGRDSQNCWVAMTEFWPSEPRPPSCIVRSDLTAGEWEYYTKYSLLYNTEDGTMVINFDIFFVRFIVEKLGAYEYIFWLYTPNEEGYLTRIYVYKTGSLMVYRRIAKVRLFKKPSQISALRDLRMETINGQSYVFAVMEKLAVQLNPVMCGGHTKCTTCAVDPYCAWLVKEAKCVRAEQVTGRDENEYRRNAQTNSTLKLCFDTCLANRKETFVISGSNAVLNCHSVCSPQDASYPIWFHNGLAIQRTRGMGEEEEEEDEEHLVELNGDSNLRIVDNGNFRLFILNATHDFSGTYECRDALSGRTFASTILNVTKYCKIEGNFESTWRREFNNWCKSYEDYASGFQDWKSQQCSNKECIRSCCEH